MPYCSTLFVLSEQYSLSWRISIVVCPDGQGEGSRVSLEHLQSTVLRKASETNTSTFKIYVFSKYHYCEFIVLAILGFQIFNFCFCVVRVLAMTKLIALFYTRKLL